MSETETLIQKLMTAIRASEPVERDRAADEVTDVHRGLSRAQVEAIARALVAARLEESDAKCEESQLNALSELSAWHQIDREILAPLAALRLGAEQQCQLEYLEQLLRPGASG